MHSNIKTHSRPHSCSGRNLESGLHKAFCIVCYCLQLSHTLLVVFFLSSSSSKCVIPSLNHHCQLPHDLCPSYALFVPNFGLNTSQMVKSRQTGVLHDKRHKHKQVMMIPASKHNRRISIYIYNHQNMYRRINILNNF